MIVRVRFVGRAGESRVTATDDDATTVDRRRSSVTRGKGSIGSTGPVCVGKYVTDKVYDDTSVVTTCTDFFLSADRHFRKTLRPPPVPLIKDALRVTFFVGSVNANRAAVLY